MNTCWLHLVKKIEFTVVDLHILRQNYETCVTMQILMDPTIVYTKIYRPRRIAQHGFVVSDALRSAGMSWTGVPMNWGTVWEPLTGTWRISVRLSVSFKASSSQQAASSHDSIFLTNGCFVFSCHPPGYLIKEILKSGEKLSQDNVSKCAFSSGRGEKQSV